MEKLLVLFWIYCTFLWAMLCWLSTRVDHLHKVTKNLCDEVKAVLERDEEENS